MKHLAVALLACYTTWACTDPCGHINGPINVGLDFTYCSLEVQPLDNRDARPVTSVDNRVPRAAIGLQLRFTSNDGVCWRPTLGNPFVTAAYACSPAEGYEITQQDTIRSIRITSVKTYNEDYPAGADLTAVFKVRSGQGAVVPTDEYFGGAFEQDYNFVHAITDDGGAQTVQLLATAPAAAGSEQQFRVEAFLSDGRVLEALTPVIIAL